MTSRSIVFDVTVTEHMGVSTVDRDDLPTRMAKAMDPQMFELRDSNGPNHALDVQMCADLVDAMRRALRAIRVPTKAMLADAQAEPVSKIVDGMIALAAAHGVVMPDVYTGDNAPLVRWWFAMVEAAIEESLAP